MKTQLKIIKLKYWNKTEEKIQACIQLLKEWEAFSVIDTRKLTQPVTDIFIPPEHAENILNRRNAGRKMAVAIINKRVWKQKNLDRVTLQKKAP